MTITTNTLDSVWSTAQRLSVADRQILINRICTSLHETESERKHRVANELEALCGAWNDDPRTTEEIKESIRSARTPNSFPKL
ncbi:MAG: hypothetical protein K2H04_11415 [Bacteroidaceae bacterium]|nr:hypothetical protein [Bacteroidaceae bacterium]